MPPQDPEYARKWSICAKFAADASCARGDSCKCSHSLVDTARIVSLVGDVSHLSIPASATAPLQPPEQIFFVIEYTKYCSQTDSLAGDVDPDAMKWRMKLCGGGRATLGTDAESISVQPAYPVKAHAPDPTVALRNLEGRVFGQCAPPDLQHHSLCRFYSESKCSRELACRFSHTLFDIKRIESLLEEAVTERAYKDYKPILEIEYFGKQSPTGKVTAAWRITLRCVLGYHQKSAPQPVVVIGTELHTAMRMLERQFAASSGKPQPPQTPNRPRPRTRTGPRQGTSTTTNSHTRKASNASTSNQTASPHTHRPPTSPSPQTNVPPGRHTPPPSYHDTMQGNYAQPTMPGTKRGL